MVKQGQHCFHRHASLTFESIQLTGKITHNGIMFIKPHTHRNMSTTETILLLLSHCYQLEYNIHDHLFPSLSSRQDNFFSIAMQTNYRNNQPPYHKSCALQTYTDVRILCTCNLCCVGTSQMSRREGIYTFGELPVSITCRPPPTARIIILGRKLNTWLGRTSPYQMSVSVAEISLKRQPHLGWTTDPPWHCVNCTLNKTTSALDQAPATPGVFSQVP